MSENIKDARSLSFFVLSEQVHECTHEGEVVFVCLSFRIFNLRNCFQYVVKI
jgi:hypothetical protein